MSSAPPLMKVILNVCVINVLPSHVVEAAEPPQPNINIPDPLIRVKAKSRGLKTDQVDFCEGALPRLLYKLCLKMIDYSSGGTWGPGPSRSRFLWQKMCYDPTKSWMLYYFCFVNFCQVVWLRLRPDEVDYWEGAIQLLF
jgi:hypothetical protein